MLAADHPLSVEFSQLEDERETLAKKRDDLRTEVRAAVNSCTTVAKLLRIWPEAKELLPAYATQTTNLPAVQVDKLNAAIGLPTEEVANG